jgi:hypothetical protein
MAFRFKLETMDGVPAEPPHAHERAADLALRGHDPTREADVARTASA